MVGTNAAPPDDELYHCNAVPAAVRLETVGLVLLQNVCGLVAVGAAVAFTVIVNAAGVAHCPNAGVKVYVVVAVLFNAGDQLPVMPLSDVVGNGDNAAPEQIGATALNVGVTLALTVIVNAAVVAHCPTAGVKVYVVVAVLFNAGDHEPVIPLSDVVGNGDNAAPEQIGATALNVGVTLGLTVIVNAAVVAH